METEEDRRRWRAALKNMGTSNVKRLLSHFDPLHLEQSVNVIGDRPPYPNLEFCQNWLRDDEEKIRRQNTRLSWIGIIVAVAALLVAVAAWISPWSDIKALFHGWF
jgi:hypothetical protein